MAITDAIIRNIKAALQRLVQVRIWSGLTVKGKTVDFRLGSETAQFRQGYGFIAIPPEDSGEGILIYPSSTRGKGIFIMADHEESRPEGFEPGDCGIFNDQGVVLKLSGKSVTITGADSVSVEDAKSVSVKGADEILLGDNGKALVTEDVLATLTAHTHPYLGLAAGTPGTTSPSAGLVDIGLDKTTVVKGE